MTTPDLASMLAPPEQPHVPPRATSGAPGYVQWDGKSGVACTRPMTDTEPTDWAAILTELGLDPETVTIEGTPEVRVWDAGDGAGGVHRMRYYKARLAPRGTEGDPVAELVDVIRRHKPRKRPAAASPGTFVVGIGDLQLGKIDKDGVEGTVERTLAGIDAAAERLKAVRKHTPISEIHIAWLGDGCEGFVSQGGANAWRTVLTPTQQTRLLRRLITRSVVVLAPLAETVNLAAVPGNHDEAVRIGGKGVTRFDSSWDVDCAQAVMEALAMNPSAYGHVRPILPALDEITVTVPLAGGLTIAHAHGNHHRPGRHWQWWEGHSFSDQPVGRADVLHEAHGHHLHIEQRSGRTWLMNPALEAESTWWRHQTGQTGDPGVLTYTVAGGRLGNIEVV